MSPEFSAPPSKRSEVARQDPYTMLDPAREAALRFKEELTQVIPNGRHLDEVLQKIDRLWPLIVRYALPARRK